MVSCASDLHTFPGLPGVEKCMGEIDWMSSLDTTFHPKSCIPESPIEICFCCQRDAPLVQHRPSFARHYVVCMSDVPSGERWCAGMSCNIHDGQKVKDHDRAIAGWVLNLAADTVVGYF